MSDQSSESSGEWVVLNEDDELSLDNVEEQPLNLQLSYDAVSDAVSESIRSSFSSEELEWQYEQFQDFIPYYRSSGIEELDYHELYTEFTEDLDVSHSEKHNSSKCAAANDCDDDKSVELSPGSKSCCYKHTRNDHVNFVLNLMLALVLASAVGLGIGHFLGWSHKCYKSTSVLKSASNFPDGVFHSSQLPEAISVMQNMKNIVDQEKKVMNQIPFSENLSDISCWDPKDGGSSIHEVRISHMNNDMAVDAVPETSILISEDVQELKTGEINQNNFSDIGLSLLSTIVTQIDWNKIDHATESFKNFDEPLEESNTQEIPSIETEKLISEKIFPFGRSEIPLADTEKSISEETSTFSNDGLRSEGAVNDAKVELLKHVYIKDDNTYKENNLTNQLREDISQVIQSLSALALARLTHVTNNNPLLVENSGLIVKYYRDFENLVNLKLSEIDNFVMSTEYKRYQKASLKHVQKMIYSVINSVDHVMKTSIKILSKNNRQINVQKFLNNISKVIFTFNKRWERNSSYWSGTIEKLKFREIKFQEKSFKKENKHWRRKYQFEKDNRSNKYQRYSMKS